MENKNNERKVKELLKKYDFPKSKKNTKSTLKEEYLKQTDRNYKDGDRN